LLVLPLIAVAILWLTCVALGPPLLVRGIRSRAFPVAAIGVALLGTGGLGFPLQVLSRQVSADQPGTIAVLAGSGLTAGTLGMMALCVFTWRVFRPGSRLSRGICFGLCLLLLASALAQALVSGLGATVEQHWLVLAMAERCIVLAWTAVEAGAYHRRLRKRCRLGLVEPMEADRFLLASVATAGACGICLVCGVALASGVLFGDSTPLGLAMTLFILATAVPLWLICIRPPAYTRFIEARATSSSR
jgi:hypothetical protein